MKASDYISEYIHRAGISCVFEMAGGMIAHLLDSLSKQENIKIVSCHHEQAAGFAAEGFARIKGIPGVALATSGPGATNLITAIGSCFFDSVPTVFITGQVNTHEKKDKLAIRQLGFQETDIVSIVGPICKSAVSVDNAMDLPRALEKAFLLSCSGRQGPCLIDIPMNIQSDDIPDSLARKYFESQLVPSYQDSLVVPDIRLDKQISNLFAVLANARRPLLLMGGGCASAANRDYSRMIIEALRLPYVSSLMAVDLLEHGLPLTVGFIGSYGNRWANLALAEADVLVVVGSRLDIRQTGSDVESFVEGKTIFQVDIDESEFGVRVTPAFCIHASIREFAVALRSSCVQIHLADEWLMRIAGLKQAFPPLREYQCDDDEINPLSVLKQLSTMSTGKSVYVTDVGQHQMWAAQIINIGSHDRFLTSGGMGAMGFGLPASIGAALASDADRIILVSGDGSLQVNVQELQTVVRNRLNIKIIVFNNDSHGMVRQFQESYFQGNLQSTAVGYSAPSFTKLAEAYGIPSRLITDSASVNAGLEWMLASSGPCLIELTLSPGSKVYPKLAFGRKFGEMEPEVSPLGMEST